MFRMLQLVSCTLGTSNPQQRLGLRGTQPHPLVCCIKQYSITTITCFSVIFSLTHPRHLLASEKVPTAFHAVERRIVYRIPEGTTSRVPDVDELVWRFILDRQLPAITCLTATKGD